MNILANNFFYYLVAVALIIVIFSVVHARPKTVTGQVVAVLDGDTIDILLRSGKKLRVRLAEIDSPEKGQSYGQIAKQALFRAIYGETVNVYVTGTDRYKRAIGTVYLSDDTNINHWMVSEGYAWAYTPYVRDRRLFDIEEYAKQSGKGLWAMSSPTPPWEWRKN